MVRLVKSNPVDGKSCFHKILRIEFLIEISVKNKIKFFIIRPADRDDFLWFTRYGIYFTAV